MLYEGVIKVTRKEKNEAKRAWLVEWAGNLRCPGQGNLPYMQRRVEADVAKKEK